MSKNLDQDFEDFQANAGTLPPKAVSSKILAYVERDLNPGVWNVFAKLSLIQFVTALLTLSVCPQFGFRVWGDGMGLMDYFMRLGDVGCPLACGAFFTGTSLILAALSLRAEEIATIRKHRLLELVSLTLLSLGFFIMASAEIVAGFVFAWALGSILGGALSLETVWAVRKYAHQRV